MIVEGVIAEIVGVGESILKALFNVIEPPPGAGFVTLTSRPPRTAPAPMAICAVSEEEFVTETDVTVIASPKETDVRPLWNPFP